MNETNYKSTGIDFVCVGFPKGGTTWLYERLSELPDFSMPLQKEIHFFDRSKKYPSSRHLEESLLRNRFITQKKWILKQISHTFLKVIKLDFKSTLFFIKWYFSDYDNKWYLSLFNLGKGISGDITPTYCLLDDGDVERMSEVLPEDIKLIFILRNPIERAWSHFRMVMRKRGKLKLEEYNFEEIKSFLVSDGQVMRTDYNNTIDRYKKYFPNNHLYISFYDFLNENPSQFLENIVEFLGGNPTNVNIYCSIDKKVKKSIKASIPIEIESLLHKQYYQLILELSTKFGGYCTQWLSEIDDRIDKPSKEKLMPYLILK